MVTQPITRLREHPIQIVLNALRHHQGRLLWALLWRTLYVIVPMQVPLLAGVIVDGLAGHRPTLYGWRLPAQPGYILMIAVGGLLIVALAYSISAYMRGLSIAHLSRRIVARLRQRIFDTLIHLPLSAHQHYGAGELLDRAISDTGALRSFVERVFVQNTTNAIRVLYPIAMLFALNGWLAVAALSVIPPQWLINRRLQNRLHKATRTRRSTRSDLVSTVKESLDGVETLQMLHAESRAVAQMSISADALEEDELHTSQISSRISGIVWLTTSIGLAITWLFGGLQVLSGTMSVGELVTFTGFVTLAYRPFRQLTSSVNTYRRGVVSLERIHELLTLPTPATETAKAAPLTVSTGRVALDAVSFAHSDAEPVLHDLTLTIPPRQITALVGRSGCGKSTILRLIARSVDPTCGQIQIDNQAIDRCALSSLRRQIAVVPQHPIIFSGTVLDNIRLAVPDATLDEVRQACRRAGALNFIDALEDGFETSLGRAGIQLSGGQMQRIAIARALLSQAAILLMDEPTSALDRESEVHLTQALTQLRRKMTVVIVTHRLHTVRCADHIVVIDEGRIAAQGHHTSLLAHSTLYQELFGANIHLDENAIQWSEALPHV